MSTPDRRKRRFSNAFRLAMSAISTHKASKSTATTSEFSSPVWFENFNKENQPAVEHGKDEAFTTPGIPQAGNCDLPGRTPCTVQQPARPPLRSRPVQSLPKQQQNTDQATGQMLSPSDSSAFTPGQTFDVSYPIDDFLGVNLDFEPGPTIYEDQDAVMHGMTVERGPSTPSKLGFQDLSILDIPGRPLPVLPTQPVTRWNRASVYVMPTNHWAGTFTEIRPNDIIMVFSKGRQAVKVDKYPLCNASRFFVQMLDGPFLELHTRCIRLRDDFPWAIRAMIDFIETGNYIFYPEMRAEYPHITMLDFHIHAYLVGNKYDVPKLRDHAIEQYINIGDMILSMDFVPNLDDSTKSNTIVAAPTYTSLNDLNSAPAFAAYLQSTEQSSAVIINTFLDSLVLLWKNTPNRHDPLRSTTLELIKPEINRLLRLPFFITLMIQVMSFGDDIVQSLAEDGFHVTSVIGLPGKRRCVMRFGDQ